MSAETNYLVLASLLISIFAAAISLVRYTNERVRGQAAAVNAYYDIVRLIDNDRAVESRGLLRASAELNRLRDVDPYSDGIQIPAWITRRRKPQDMWQQRTTGWALF